MTTMAEVKGQLRAAGYLVDDDLWPTEAFHILTLGSKRTDLDRDVLSDKLAKVLGIANVVLPKNPRHPNLYHFLAYRAQADTSYFDDKIGQWVKAPFLVGEVEDYLDDIEFAMVNPYPVTSTPDDAVEMAQQAEDWMKSGEDSLTPILIGSQEKLNAGTWYFIRVLSNTGMTIRSGEIKVVLESTGARVMAPDEGLVGWFFPGDKVIGKGSTRIFYMPADGPKTVAEIEALIQSQVPLATVGAYTTDRLASGQSFVDTMYRVGESGDVVGTGLSDLMKLLEKLLKVIPYALWFGIGLLGLYGVTKVYGAYYQQGKPKRSRA